MDKETLIKTTNEIAEMFENGEIPYLLHLCGGNEEQLIEIFKDFKTGDYVFSTHRTHYHYLMAGGTPEKLKKEILDGNSMYLYDKNVNFLSTSVLAGGACISAGIAMGLKLSGSDRKVWCFIGDGAEDEGHFYEAVRYVESMELPCTFIIEDNDRSISSSREERFSNDFDWSGFKCVTKYHYTPVYPHSGTGSGKWIKFKIME